MSEVSTGKNKGHIFKRLNEYFNTYEKVWMIVIVVLTLVMSILLPEEDVHDENGIVIASGLVLTILYLFDSIIGCLCELLFSKQNKIAFLIYNVVEVIEITAMILLRTRFASMAVALFYWIPAHTLGYFQWRKHKDKKDDTKTVVRGLKTWQTILIFAVTIIWTVGFGYLIAAYSPETDFYSSNMIMKVVAYLDACLSIMSIIDGILMFFRSRESWWTWYLYIIVETVVNILSGQWILLVYKFGYITNTTYGLIKWTKYIKEQKQE